MNVSRICKLCGGSFIGSPHAWYCSTCKERRERERREKELQQAKNDFKEKGCCICGKKFLTYTNAETCGKKCRKAFRSQRLTGRKCSDTTKSKIAIKNSIYWHIVSPEGKHYRFHNLTQWARENCDLFGFDYGEGNVGKIVSGISQAKGAMLGTRKSAIPTYKDWQVVIDHERDYN